jgi:hypothetical protein
MDVKMTGIELRKHRSQFHDHLILTKCERTTNDRGDPPGITRNERADDHAGTLRLQGKGMSAEYDWFHG